MTDEAESVRIAFFGSSLVSAYWNGAATYYRGLLAGLAEHGYLITFYEPAAFDRQRHRDIDDPPWARVVVYPATEEGVQKALRSAAAEADVLIKASGVGVFDRWLEREVAELGGGRQVTIFWDVDAPATLERMAADARDPLRALLPRYDAVLTCGGGERAVAGYLALGARVCRPIYNALDPTTHYPPARHGAAAVPVAHADLLFIGNRLPDREARAEEFFFSVARRMPERRFVLGGDGWEDSGLPDNVLCLGHVYTADHNLLNASALAVLNVHRDSMARYGTSPATRLFEAAGAGACVISDACEGLDRFLLPEREILLARDGHEVERHLRALTPTRAAEIGARARRRMLSWHTYDRRALEVDGVLGGLRSSARERERRWATPTPVTTEASPATADEGDAVVLGGPGPAGTLAVELET